MVEPSHFERVHHTVVRMRRVMELEAQLLVCRQFLLIVLNDA